MKTKILAFGLITASSVMFSCKSELTIARGTSFGKCQGYCNKELVVAASSITYNEWQNGGQPRPKTRKEEGDQSASLKELADGFNLSQFYKMDKTIGCPDCADGGAEWLEVKKGKNTTRVTYEYGKAPENLKVAAEKLKGLQQKFEQTLH